MFLEDLSPFFDTATGFATSDTLAGLPVSGLFDSAYLLEDLGGGVAASGPVYTLPSASVPASVVGAVLVHGGRSYKVVEPMPDGSGITVLRLRA